MRGYGLPDPRAAATIIRLVKQDRANGHAAWRKVSGDEIIRAARRALRDA